VIRMKNLALNLRTHSKVKIRQPLGTLYVRPRDVADRKVLENVDYAAQILEESNVKKLELVEDPLQIGVTVGIKPDAKKLKAADRKYLKEIARAMEQYDPAAILTGGRYDVKTDTQTFQFTPEETIPSFVGPANLTCGFEQLTFMALDTALTPELLLEGVARDFNRLVQDQRKAIGLEISDRIAVVYAASPRIAEAIGAHHDYLCNELLAERLESVAAPPDGAAKLSLSGEEVFVAVTRV